MYGGAAQPSPAQLAQARLAAQNTLYNAAIGVVLLHSGEKYLQRGEIFSDGDIVADNRSGIPFSLLLSSLHD